MLQSQPRRRLKPTRDGLAAPCSTRIKFQKSCYMAIVGNAPYTAQQSAAEPRQFQPCNHCLSPQPLPVTQHITAQKLVLNSHCVNRNKATYLAKATRPHRFANNQAAREFSR